MQIKKILKTGLLIMVVAISVIHGQSVFAGPSAPTITSINAVNGNGYYKDGDTVAIAVHFSQAVNVTNAPFLGLNTGSTANYASGSGTNTLIFNYGVWFGANQNPLNVNYVSLNGSGTIMDTATNTVNADLSMPSGQNLADNNTIVIDNTAPTIDSAIITGAHEVTVTFSENVLNNFSSEYTNLGGVLAGHTIMGQAGNGGTNKIVLTFDGASLLGGGTGTMDISNNIIDYAGNHFAGVSNQVITLGTPSIITSAVYRDVDNSGTVSGTDTVTFLFSKPVDTSTIDATTINTRMVLDNAHTFGSSAQGLVVNWLNNQTLVVTFGSDATLANNDSVVASNQVVDSSGMYDFNNTKVTIHTDRWYARYWNWGSGTSPDLTGLPATPDFIQNVSSANGYDFDAEWGFDSPDGSIHDDNFVGILEKTSYFNEGVYRIHLDSDDGIIFKIDGGKVVMAWQDVYAGDFIVPLSGGYHTFQVYYYENVGGAHLHVNVLRMPVISDASVTGATLTMNYDQVLNTGSVPDVVDYQVMVNGKTSPVTSVVVGGNSNQQVILHLTNAVNYGDLVTVTYNPGMSLVMGQNSAPVAALSNQFVQNNTAAVVSQGSSSGQGTPWTPLTQPTATTSKTSYTFPRTLKLGMKGDDVVILQKFLKVTPVASKNFGLKTKFAVMTYQKNHGLVADGILGAKSRAAIELELNK